MKEIPYFSVPELNSFEEYERFKHTKAYLGAKSDLVPDRPGRREGLERTRELMRAAGYGDLDKFRLHREQWNGLLRNVPKGYLDNLQVDYKMLEYFNSLDMQLYEQALELPLFPKVGVVRIMAGVYRPYRFPEGTGEEEAIEMLADYCRSHRWRFAVNFPDFKTTFVDPDGNRNVIMYPPKISWSNKFLKVRENGRGIGTTRIG